MESYMIQYQYISKRILVFTIDFRMIRKDSGVMFTVVMDREFDSMR